MQPADGPGSTTRDQLLRAAEELFARHGTESVSLRKVNTASGARNAAAVQYHFGDRAGLVRAILDKHQPDVESRRHALLDAYEGLGHPDPRQLSGALVRPLASKLTDPNGGPEFLRIYGELLNRSVPIIDLGALDDRSNSMYRWRELASDVVDDEALRHHRRFAALLYTVTELGRHGDDEVTDPKLLTSLTIDTVAGMLTAPTSDETRRLAAD